MDGLASSPMSAGRELEQIIVREGGARDVSIAAGSVTKFCMGGCARKPCDHRHEGNARGYLCLEVVVQGGLLRGSSIICLEWSATGGSGGASAKASNIGTRGR